MQYVQLKSIVQLNLYISLLRKHDVLAIFTVIYNNRSPSIFDSSYRAFHNIIRVTY